MYVVGVGMSLKNKTLNILDKQGFEVVPPVLKDTIPTCPSLFLCFLQATTNIH